MYYLIMTHLCSWSPLGTSQYISHDTRKFPDNVDIMRHWSLYLSFMIYFTNCSTLVIPSALRFASHAWWYAGRCSSPEQLVQLCERTRFNSPQVVLLDNKGLEECLQNVDLVPQLVVWIVVVLCESRHHQPLYSHVEKLANPRMPLLILPR